LHVKKLEARCRSAVWKAGQGIDLGLEELKKGKGKAYDAVIADACINLIVSERFKWRKSA